jgi:hypothetical protein
MTRPRYFFEPVLSKPGPDTDVSVKFSSTIQSYKHAQQTSSIFGNATPTSLFLDCL